ncbi:MAG: hypothetical protein K0R93_383 [Anaerosolibacter sp.]|jgi:hypothetical protein|uniref:hypothetical protein n=1 Tax=Anaerosolibacter sp. TaxID=1872527 RepID=UPI00260B23B4|nr:hypothetical protein [Anaerosolibacter sp.]MDF2545485.1 hypothetical protein [Anaerosolibacter sp.]
MKNNQNAYTLDLVMLPNDKLEEYNKFLEQYGNVPDKYILREMYRVKGTVSQEVLSQHIKNLDALSTMEGFVTDDHKQRIEMVKNILTAETRISRPSQQAEVETQFWGGSSLLLWFLTLAAIWRRPFFF